MTRKLKWPLAIVLILIELFLSACARRPAGVRSFPLSSEIRSSAVGTTALHMATADDFETIISSERLSLLFDRRTGGVAVLDKEADAYWTALPLYWNLSGAVLTAAVVSEKDRCYLNTQDHSVAYGGFRYEKTDAGLKIVYGMSDLASVAVKTPETLAPGELYVRIPVVFTLKDNELRVSVECDEIFVSDGYVLESLAVLPYFGALPDGTKDASAGFGDYLVVPDGCGALIRTDRSDYETQNLTFRLYSNENGVNTAPAAVGCFGVSHGNVAAAGLITKGDAIASVRAIRATANTDGVNLVYPEFNITPYQTTKNTYIFGSTYTGTIEVCYQILHGSSGEYAPMAAAFREMLIRAGFLTETTAAKGEYPMNVSFLFSVDGKRATSVGTFEQAEEVTGLLKAKGVNGIRLYLNGIFNGGLYQTMNYHVIRSAGGKKDLRTLCEYANAQNIPVFASVNLFTESSPAFASVDLQGKKQIVEIKNPLYPFVSASPGKRYAASSARIEKHVLRFLQSTTGLPLDGIAVNDASFVYADAAAGAEKTAGLIGAGLSSIAARGRVCLNGGGFRFLKNADGILSLPETTVFASSAAYTPVPLLQMILHGSVVYSMGACNKAEIPVLSMLKSVEYGASLAVEWDFLPSSAFYYERTYSDVADFYVRASQTMADLSDRRIVGHEAVNDGVTVVTYDNGAIVYVNYNNYSVNIGSFSVPPYDFLRIN